VDDEIAYVNLSKKEFNGLFFCVMKDILMNIFEEESAKRMLDLIKTKYFLDEAEITEECQGSC
jgi:hypothetical protein